MTRTLLSVAALLFVVSACSDELPEKADGPLGPVVQKSQAEAGAANAPTPASSTTCQSFRKELDGVDLQLIAQPNAEELLQKRAALAPIVADVCN